jgi:surfeit locus 1 family protein
VDDSWPRGGMTVVHFRDQHLQYALTWFVLAGMTLFAAWTLMSGQRRLRHHGRNAQADAPNDHRN